MSQKQRNGPPLTAGRLNSQAATTATIAVHIVTDTAVSRLSAARTYRLEDLPERIRAHVTIDPVSDCWVSSLNIDKDGYSRHGGEGVHRIAWRELVGPIPNGLVLDHVKTRGCEWNACCWPGHLEPVPHRINVLRGTSFAAVNAAKEGCVHGHPFDLFNTYFRPNGHRDCRACIRDRVAKYRHGLRELRRVDLGQAA